MIPTRCGLCVGSASTSEVGRKQTVCFRWLRRVSGSSLWLGCLTAFDPLRRLVSGGRHKGSAIVSENKGTTLRLNLPQWQGGNLHDYRFGSELLTWLAPPANGPVE